jgi:hypothetical protein
MTNRSVGLGAIQRDRHNLEVFVGLRLARSKTAVTRVHPQFLCYEGYASPYPNERIFPDGTFKLVFNAEHGQFSPIHVQAM